MNIILALDHPEGSINNIVGILFKFFLSEIFKLLCNLLRYLLFLSLLTLEADCEFCLAACARTASDLKESFLIFRMDSKREAFGTALIASNNFVPIVDVHFFGRLGAAQSKALTPLNGQANELTVFMGDREHFLAFFGLYLIPNGFSRHLTSLLLLTDGTDITDPLLNDFLSISTQLLFPLRAFGAHESLACKALWLFLACLHLNCA